MSSLFKVGDYNSILLETNDSRIFLSMYLQRNISTTATGDKTKEHSVRDIH